MKPEKLRKWCKKCGDNTVDLQRYQQVGNRAMIKYYMGASSSLVSYHRLEKAKEAELMLTQHTLLARDLIRLRAHVHAHMPTRNCIC